MARYIDADKVLLELQKFSLDTSNPYGVGYSDCLTAVEDVLNEAPTADVEEVKHGEWIEKEEVYGDVYYTCSNCNNDWTTIDGTPQQNFMNYCPNCGAKMDGGKEE